MKRLLPAAVLGALALVGVTMTFGGTDPDAVPTLPEVSGRVMSPFCPGLTLDECPTDQSARLRSQLESMIRQGSTNREIDQWVVDNYGEVALASPNKTFAWAAPVALAIAGLGLTVVLVSRLAGKDSDGEPSERPEPKLDADDAELVEQDFLRYQRGTE